MAPTPAKRCPASEAACRRDHIAAKLGHWAHPDEKPWAYEARCPECGHGGFSITAPDHATVTLRNIFACNCLRCQCDMTDVREALLSLGISRACLGIYGRAPARAKSGSSKGNVVPWPDVDKVLRDPGIRALADLKIRLREARFGPAPQDWCAFLAFAAEAGVPQSGRYDAAARMGRRRPQR